MCGIDIDELELEAEVENLPTVQLFVDKHLNDAKCPSKIQKQIDVAVEEIFVNIASYAYAPATGMVVLKLEMNRDLDKVNISFIDKGIPYDPLKNEEPDITLSAEEREIGGLGIFLVKQTMDEVRYEHKDGQNILTISKAFGNK